MFLEAVFSDSKLKVNVLKEKIIAIEWLNGYLLIEVKISKKQKTKNFRDMLVCRKSRIVFIIHCSFVRVLSLPNVNPRRT